MSRVDATLAASAGGWIRMIRRLATDDDVGKVGGKRAVATTLVTGNQQSNARTMKADPNKFSEKFSQKCS